MATGDDGYPLRKRIEENVLDSEIIWAPAVKGGAVLMSTRGGDYELTVGQDLSIGYASSDSKTVELYLTESFTFRVLEAKAAISICLRPGQPSTRSWNAGTGSSSGTATDTRYSGSPMPPCSSCRGYSALIRSPSSRGSSSQPDSANCCSTRIVATLRDDPALRRRTRDCR